MVGGNAGIAEQLREIGDLLELQEANPFRVSAYRRAAETVAGLDRPLAAIDATEGRAGLERLPGIGSGIAGVVHEILATGRSSRLENLRGQLEPEQVFQAVPGIGPALARRIFDRLHVESLEGLEVAAHDGRLEAVPGVGARRAEGIRLALEQMLARRPRLPGGGAGDEPGVDTLLAVDREYRRRAEAGELPTIAPRRFNPEGRAWLPILHADRDGWHFTALFSNSARAHELDRTHDWVVIYFYDEAHHEGQRTVVTENRGVLAGERVVRGREAECRRRVEGGD